MIGSAIEGIRSRMNRRAPSPPYATLGNEPGSSGASRKARPASASPSASIIATRSAPRSGGAPPSGSGRSRRLTASSAAYPASRAASTAANIQCCRAPPASSSAPATTPRPPVETRSAISTTAKAIASKASAVAYPTAVQAMKAEAATATPTAPGSPPRLAQAVRGERRRAQADQHGDERRARPRQVERGLPGARAQNAQHHGIGRTRPEGLELPDRVGVQGGNPDVVHEVGPPQVARRVEAEGQGAAIAHEGREVDGGHEHGRRDHREQDVPQEPARAAHHRSQVWMMTFEK